MSSGSTETYRPRATVDRGVWDLDIVKFKIYELLAEGKTVTREMIDIAGHFLREDVLGDVEDMGDSNGLGFVIIHPGDTGLTIAAHWWAQGSVLCQRIYRHQYSDAKPLDTINRPAVACVWELDIITAEQNRWRETMMQPEPDETAYLTPPLP
ncbi:hypothetical protein [uncultured Sulfitobacter sp.]|uniref:hypothetical protein n=1 Tax=uncultured Sulfitobacter sp. TaxID=191468 RepID=UPI00262736D5|nr:hypothetical protein [uncultured Sulfitobacter sp.]